MNNLLVILLCAGQLLGTTSGLQGDFSGCFTHPTTSTSGPSDFSFLVNTPSAADTPLGCIAQCKQSQYKYAGIHNGQQCLCASSLSTSSQGNETCPINCSGNPSQLCGGTSSISAYETGIMVSGPPRSISLTDKNENALKIVWESPSVPNGSILEYHVTATPTSSYSVSSVALPMEWTFPNSTQKADLLGLQPGTGYNISIKAKTADGYGSPLSVVFNTEIGAPDTPESPAVIKSSNSTATIQLKPVLPSKGPISAYRIVVLNEDAASIGIHKDTQLKTWPEAKTGNLPYYITAELKPEQFKQEFVVGDGLTYGKYMNPPLPDDREVLFVLGVVSIYGGVSKSSFSEPSKPIGAQIPDGESKPTASDFNVVTQPSSQQTPAIVEEDPNTNGNSIIQLLEETDLIDKITIRKTKPITSGRGPARRQRRPYSGKPPPLVIGLSAAVGVLGFLLILSIFVYFYLRHKVHRNDLNSRGRRKPSDRQVLTMHGSTSTIELESGYVHSSFVMGIEETSVDHYDSLMKRLWTIPPENVIKSSDVLGSGGYGKVMKGYIQRGESKIESALTGVEDSSLAAGQKNAMLKDLSVLVKVGQHANIAGFIGVCEEPEGIIIAMENYGTNLKEFLLNSRALNNYPSYATKEQRFSTLHEAQAIDIALGIARGMAYLQSLSVPHKRLASRTIFICSTDGTVPKISGFGMDFYQPPGQGSDFKRWMAPEALSSPQHAPKCEVWAFAVILWEIATLGATPYVDVKAKELAQRVQRGMRLKQPGNVGLSLYQIMVSCWQIDLDERPGFQELVEILQQAFNTPLNYLSFNLFPDFNYEKYDPNVELNR